MNEIPIAYVRDGIGPHGKEYGEEPKANLQALSQF
jgi:hypothetical protein